MSNDYVRRVTAWITAEQDAKIRGSGMSDSDFIRDAIEEKDYQFHEMKSRMENALIDDLIKYLSDKKDAKRQTTCQTNKQKMGENVRQLYQEISTRQTNLSDKTGSNVRQKPEEVFGKHLLTIVNVLHMNGKIPQKQKDIISNNLGITNKELQDNIDRYHDELMQMTPHNGW